MPARRKVPDDDLLAAYWETGSVKAAGERLGINGSSVHERLQRLGVARRNPRFTEEDDERVLREYIAHRDAGTVKELANAMGRTVPFLCRQARRLGLTDPKHVRMKAATWKYMPEDEARVYLEEFRASSMGLKEWCEERGIDDLGFSRKMQDLFPDEYECIVELAASADSTYAVGRRFEYRVRNALVEHGYFAWRSHLSRSPVDVVAMRHGQPVIMVQCRLGAALQVADWNEMYDIVVSTGAVPILAALVDGQVRMWRMTGRKDGSKRPQPMVPWDPATNQSLGEVADG